MRSHQVFLGPLEDSRLTPTRRGTDDRPQSSPAMRGCNPSPSQEFCGLIATPQHVIGGEQVGHRVGTAALPCRALEQRPIDLTRPACASDTTARAVHATVSQRGEELAPDDLVLGIQLAKFTMNGATCIPRQACASEDSNAILTRGALPGRVDH